MSDPTHPEIPLRRYLLVFVVVVIGTILSVATSQMEFRNGALKIALILGIAGVQAGFVGASSLHLISERKLIYVVLAFTVFFLIILMYLTLLGHHDHPNLLPH